jgi:hypothetical protein
MWEVSPIQKRGIHTCVAGMDARSGYMCFVRLRCGKNRNWKEDRETRPLKNIEANSSAIRIELESLTVF